MSLFTPSSSHPETTGLLQKRWLFLDPGKTTGYVVLGEEAEMFTILEAGEFTGTAQLEDLIPTTDEVVMEEVQHLAPHFDASGIRVAGVVHHFCDKHHILLRTVSPAQLQGAKHWGKALQGVAHLPSHARDALVHAYVLLGRTKPILGVSLEWPNR
ncbi:MAG TPA: hypothetical protein PLF11_00265 [Bacillota bacterium]|nr:hypothetical protein [Dermatophilaceae bacterium]HOI35792.1 hypothetical protein [Bacillota bacterium]